MHLVFAKAQREQNTNNSLDENGPSDREGPERI